MVRVLLLKFILVIQENNFMQPIKIFPNENKKNIVKSILIVGDADNFDERMNNAFDSLTVGGEEIIQEIKYSVVSNSDTPYSALIVYSELNDPIKDGQNSR